MDKQPTTLTPEELEAKRKAHSEYRKAYYQRNRDKIRAQNKAGRERRKAEDPERYRAMALAQRQRLQAKAKKSPRKIESLDNNRDKDEILAAIVEERAAARAALGGEQSRA